jgi:Leucine-rich repeat (LRR) protein
MSTQALVDSICANVRSYLHIPTTFQDYHVHELARAIENSPNHVENVTVAPSVTTCITVLLQQVTRTLLSLRIEEPTLENLIAVIQLIRETSTLTTLELCGITCTTFHEHDDGVMQDLTDALRVNTSIKVLDLSNNHLTDTIANALLGRLLQETVSNHCTIECLMLNKNQLMDITWLCCALKRNTILKCLSLADNQIDNLQPLVSLLQTNRTLERIYVYGNKLAPNDSHKAQLSMSLRLNVLRRQLVSSQEERDLQLGLYAHVFAKVAKEPALVYGLFCELPHVWSLKDTRVITQCLTL